MIEISKELLSDVLGVTVTEIYGVFGNELQAELKHQDYTYSVNIYELAHKCKEWAYNKGYNLVTIKYENIYECFDFNWDYNDYCDTFNGDTPVEAIIKGCQWILKETSK